MSHAAAADDQLIDLIYACLLGEASWQDFLGHLARTLPDGMSTLFYHDASTGRGNWQLNHGLPPEAVGKYADHYSRLNPWMAAASIRRIGVGVVAEQMYPRDRLLKTEFYNDYFRRLGGESAVGITIVREEGRSFLLSTMTSRAVPDENVKAAEQLTRLAPHLRRVFRHFRAGPHYDAASGQECSLFDAINIGVALVTEGEKLKSLSKTGQEIVDSRGCARTTVTGKFRISSDDADAALKHMLDRSYRGPRVAVFVVNSVKLTLILTQKDPYLAYFTGPTVAVLMEPLERQFITPEISHFATAYRLTAAEQRVFSGIMSGRSVDEIAAAAGLSRETIRSQMKSLYAKLDVSGQVDLLRLMKSPVFQEAQRGPLS